MKHPLKQQFVFLQVGVATFPKGLTLSDNPCNKQSVTN